MSRQAEQGVVVGTALPSDAPALVHLHGTCFARGWDVESIRQFLGDPACIVRLARHSSEAAVQGFLICRASGGEAEILTLAVAPDVRGQGIGLALWQAAREDLQARGVARVVLEVGEENAAALALYRKLGFREVGRRKGCYQEASSESRRDGLIMACALET